MRTTKAQPSERNMLVHKATKGRGKKKRKRLTSTFFSLDSIRHSEIV
jgi:hypothetical protein